MSLIDRISGWFRERLGMEDLPFFRTPDYMYHVGYWLGSLVAAAFAYEVVSGLMLLLYYYPESPYDQTLYIMDKVPYGSVLLFSHLYGAYIMIFLVYVHMFRNYFVGAYKRPREILWILGVILLALTLGASFVGYSLIGDVLGVDALGVGKGLVGALPGGNVLVSLFFGNGTTQDLFTRLLAWHIILVALIGFFFAIHFFLAEHYGIMPSLKVRPKVPAIYTKEEWSKFNPWWPRNFVYMMSLVLMTWGIILVIPDLLANINGLPLVLNPHPAPSPTSPAASTVPPYPPWFFLFFYKLVDFLLPNGSSLTLLQDDAIAMIVLAYLVLLPFLDRSTDLNPLSRGRKVFTWIGVMFVVYLVQLSVWGFMAPGVPEPFPVQVMVLLPPAVVSALGVWTMKPEGVKPSSSRVRSDERKGISMRSVVPLWALAVSAAAVTLAGTVGDFLSSPTILGAVLTVGLLAFLSLAFRRSGSAPAPAGGDEKVVGRAAWKLNLAEGLMAVLFSLSVVLAFQMWTIPPIGPASTYFGIDLGLIFLMLGEGLSLYHYVVYGGGPS